MDEFVSTFTNRLDQKGRVSIPAPFRAVLAVDGFDGLYCCPTLDRQAVDAGGNRLRATIGASLKNFEPFSEDHELLSTTLIGESEILKIDQDGRVILTESIKAYAGIADRVTFVGQVATSFRSGSPIVSSPTGKRPRPGCATSGSDCSRTTARRA